MKGRILSGVQPTGNFHLGNYLGAVNNWVKLQNDYECLFCAVDLHALTTEYDSKKIADYTREVAAAYIASGVDPKRSIIFPQSAVSAHAELGWIFSCMTPLGWLNRMTQFKEKAGKNREKASLGLYSYPVLMAADILAYKATHVPVGEDQKQHLELCRDIAGVFNRSVKKDFFQLPEPLIQSQGARIMSLRNGTEKMSKSDPSEGARINLKDSNDIIEKKIKKAKTDADPFPDSMEAAQSRPEVVNLITIFSMMTEQDPQSVCREFSGGNFSPFKKSLSEAVIEKMAPIRDEFYRLMSDSLEIDRILKNGSEKAFTIAKKTMSEVFGFLGLYK